MGAGAQGANGARGRGLGNKILRRILADFFEEIWAVRVADVAQKRPGVAGKGLARGGGSAYPGRQAIGVLR